MTRQAWIHMAVVAALFTGLCLLLLAPGSVSWVDVIVTFVVGGGIYAAALVGLMAEYQRLRPEGPGCAARIAVAVMGIIGTVASVVLLGILQFPRGDWQQLPVPPEPAAEILDSAVYMVFGDEVWIRSESGNVYSLGCGDNLSCEWEPQDEVPQLETRADQFCDTSEARYQPPFKWGRSRDEQVKHFCGTDYSVETHFRLMEDGTLWRWETFRGMGSAFVSLIAIVVGIILAFLVTLLWSGPGSTESEPTG